MSKGLDVVSLNKRAWERVAEKYCRAHYGKVSEMFDFFCEKLPKGSSVLDVGCGTGLPFAKLLVERNFNVVGIDVSSRMVRIAQKNVPKAEFRELSMTDIHFENEFEGVLSSFSMLLLDPPLFKDVAGRIVRSLKNDGLFYLALNEPREEGADVEGEAVVEIMGEKMYSRAYTKNEVLEAFVPLGMKRLKFNREIRTSKEFGEEHVIEFMLKKTKPMHSSLASAHVN